MKQLLFIISIFLILLALYSLERWPDSPVAVTTDKAKNFIQQTAREIASESKQTPKPSLTEIQEFVRLESLAIGHIDENPEATKQKLVEYVEALDVEGFATLANLALNVKNNGDQRFLAVYLMALSTSEIVVDHLMDVAEAPMPSARMDERLMDQEIIIRTQALEGLAKIGSVEERRKRLNQYLSRQSHVSLAGQAHRLLQDL